MSDQEEDFDAAFDALFDSEPPPAKPAEGERTGADAQDDDGGRALYRPSTPPPPLGADDDFAPDATRVAALPAELLAELGRKPVSERPTAPPPGADADADAETAADSEISWDDEETRMADIGSDVASAMGTGESPLAPPAPPVVAPPAPPVVAPPAPPVVAPPAPPVVAPPAPPVVAPPTPAAGLDLDDLLSDDVLTEAEGRDEGGAPIQDSAPGLVSDISGLHDTTGLAPGASLAELVAAVDSGSVALDDDDEAHDTVDVSPGDEPAERTSSPSGDAAGETDAPELTFDFGDAGGAGQSDAPELSFETLAEPSATSAPPAGAEGEDGPALIVEDDDDGPALSFADDDDDDDGPEMSFADDDDDEPEMSFADDDGDDDDDEPEMSFDEEGFSLDDGLEDELDSLLAVDDEEPKPDSSDDAAARPRADAGAVAARRLARGRKRRPEDLPLIGGSTAALAARRDLLLALAHRSLGGQQAKLLLAASELALQLGDVEGARGHVREAHEADPTDAVALRAVRQDALHAGDLDEAIRLLQVETKLPLSPEDKANTLALLAELQLHGRGDADAARKSVQAALAVQPKSVALNVLLAEANIAMGREGTALDAMAHAAEAVADPQARGALYAHVAEARERGGATAKASALYKRSLDAAPGAPSALVGAARVAATLGADDAPERVASLADLTEAPPVASALRRLAARMWSGAGEWDRAREQLVAASGYGERPEGRYGSSERLALRLLSEVESRRGDHAAAAAVAMAWGGATSGRERATAMIAAADGYAGASELDQARAALDQAQTADPQLLMTQMMRENVARLDPDHTAIARSVQTGDDGGPLVAAAKLAADRAHVDEARLLNEAREDAEGGLTADVVGLDVSAALEALPEVSEALAREAERSDEDRRVSALLALSSVRLMAEDAAGAAEALESARALHEHEPAVLRPLAMMHSADLTGAEHYLAEAEGRDPDANAFAAMRAGRVFLAAGEPDRAAAAFEVVLAAASDYLPALWALERIAQRTDDRELLLRVNLAQSECVTDPLERASRYARAGLLTLEAAEDETALDTARELFLHALDARPGDPILQDFVARVGARGGSGELLEAAAEGASPALARTQRLRAAAAFEEAGDYGRAAGAYRAVLAHDADDPIALHNVDRVELLAGEHARVASRRFAALRDAEARADGSVPSDAEKDLPSGSDQPGTTAAAEAEAEENVAPSEAFSTLPPAHEVGAAPDPSDDAPLSDSLVMTPSENLPRGEGVAAADAARVAALAALAELDLDERNDVSSAVMSLRSLLEIAPGHIPTLRALERHYMDVGNDDALVEIEAALSAHLTAPEDVAAHLPFAARLKTRSADDGTAADDLWITHGRRALPTERVARNLAGAADAQGDAAAMQHACRVLASQATDPAERATYLLRGAAARRRAQGAQGAAAELGREQEAVLSHPVAAAELAEAREAAGFSLPAAEAYVSAARLANAPSRQLRYFHAAGSLFHDKHEDDQALRALAAAAEIDITHRDTFRRLREILLARGDTGRLAELTAERLEAGGDAATLAELHFAQAELSEMLEDTEAAKEALRAGLALKPDAPAALERLARLSLDAQDWRKATESLIRLARVAKAQKKLKWVFFQLGDIYDAHMPDDRRAEAAFRRVLKIAPGDLSSLDRLATLYARTERPEEAVRSLQKMAELDSSVTKKRDHRLRIGTTLEQMGHIKQAERAFDDVRRRYPTDIEVIRAIADFHERQGAAPTLNMHLGRAIAEFRRGIEHDPSDSQHWEGLAAVLVRKGMPDGARCAASAATALGLPNAQRDQAVDTRGGVPGAGNAAADPAMKEPLAPDELSHAALVVFERAADAFNKLMPFDAKAWRLEKPGRDHPIRAEANAVGRWFGMDDVQVRLTSAAPMVCVPVAAKPPTVVVGTQLIAHTSPREREFLFARALEIAKARLSVAMRAQPSQLALTIAALVHHYDPHYLPTGVDEAHLADSGKRVFKALPRSARNEMGPLAVEMAGRPGFDPTRVGLAAGELGNRVALLATGDLTAALSALLKLNGRTLEGEPKARAQAVRGVPETAALLRFSISDAYFDARKRAGADTL